jgi:hypothetical protein
MRTVFACVLMVMALGAGAVLVSMSMLVLMFMIVSLSRSMRVFMVMDVLMGMRTFHRWYLLSNCYRQEILPRPLGSWKRGDVLVSLNEPRFADLQIGCADKSDSMCKPRSNLSGLHGRFEELNIFQPDFASSLDHQVQFDQVWPLPLL